MVLILQLDGLAWIPPWTPRNRKVLVRAGRACGNSSPASNLQNAVPKMPPGEWEGEVLHMSNIQVIAPGWGWETRRRSATSDQGLLLTHKPPKWWALIGHHPHAPSVVRPPTPRAGLETALLDLSWGPGLPDIWKQRFLLPRALEDTQLPTGLSAKEGWEDGGA